MTKRGRRATILVFTAACVISAHAMAAGGAEKQTVQENHREQVMRIASSWVPALLSGSVERNLAFYTDDVVLAGGRIQEVCVGRAQVEKLLTQLLGDTSPTHCSIKVQGIDITGDWAELRATFKAVWKPKKETVKLERESSNYIWLLRRQTDDSWKIARFLWYPNDRKE